MNEALTPDEWTDIMVSGVPKYVADEKERDNLIRLRRAVRSGYYADDAEVWSQHHA